MANGEFNPAVRAELMKDGVCKAEEGGPLNEVLAHYSNVSYGMIDGKEQLSPNLLEALKAVGVETKVEFRPTASEHPNLPGIRFSEIHKAYATIEALFKADCDGEEKTVSAHSFNGGQIKYVVDAKGKVHQTSEEYENFLRIKVADSASKLQLNNNEKTVANLLTTAGIKYIELPRLREFAKQALELGSIDSIQKTLAAVNSGLGNVYELELKDGKPSALRFKSYKDQYLSINASGTIIDGKSIDNLPVKDRIGLLSIHGNGRDINRRQEAIAELFQSQVFVEVLRSLKRKT